MAQKLSEFVAEVKKSIEAFDCDYIAKHAERGDEYPLMMKDGNEGLWFEFFLTYMQSGEL